MKRPVLKYTSHIYCDCKISFFMFFSPCAYYSRLRIIIILVVDVSRVYFLCPSSLVRIDDAPPPSSNELVLQLRHVFST
jgi:hypothetical protein